MVPAHDDEALMEAVYSRGPMAITIDAAQPGFRFYSGGDWPVLSCAAAAAPQSSGSLL